MGSKKPVLILPRYMLFGGSIPTNSNTETIVDSRLSPSATFSQTQPNSAAV